MQLTLPLLQRCLDKVDETWSVFENVGVQVKKMIQPADKTHGLYLIFFQVQEPPLLQMAIQLRQCALKDSQS